MNISKAARKQAAQLRQMALDIEEQMVTAAICVMRLPVERILVVRDFKGMVFKHGITLDGVASIGEIKITILDNGGATITASGDVAELIYK